MQSHSQSRAERRERREKAGSRMVIQRGHRKPHPLLRLQPGCQVSPELHKMETRRAAQLTVNTQPFFFQAGSWRSWNPVFTCPCAHDAPALLPTEHNLLKSMPSSHAPRPDLPRPRLRLRKHRPHCPLPRAGLEHNNNSMQLSECLLFSFKMPTLSTTVFVYYAPHTFADNLESFTSALMDSFLNLCIINFLIHPPINVPLWRQFCAVLPQHLYLWTEYSLFFSQLFWTLVLRPSIFFFEKVHTKNTEPLRSTSEANIILYINYNYFSYSKFLLAIYFTYGNVSFHVILSIHLTLSSPLPMSISLLPVSVSPLLPCK